MRIDTNTLYLSVRLARVKDGAHKRGLPTRAGPMFDPWSRKHTRHFWLHLGRRSYGIAITTPH